MENKRYIIIADAHITGGDGDKVTKDFFDLLDASSDFPQDVSVVFLGDVFELWVALNGYEQDVHRRFIDWCTKEKVRRKIFFIEGNHEYFVTNSHKDAFSCVSARRIADGETLFVHGDLINTRDFNYQFFRILVRSFAARAALVLSSSWIGPRVAEKIRTGLKTSNMEFKISLPVEKLKHFSRSCTAKGFKKTFVGHFHQRVTPDVTGGAEILPAFAEKGEIVFYDGASGDLVCAPWREITDKIKTSCRKEAEEK